MSTMTVTRDVVLDLLPLYFAGHVSADTKALVDEFLRSDPDFARMSQRLDTLIEKRRDTAAAVAAAERRALQQTRRRLRYRNQMIGFAVACSLVPFTFSFRGDQIEWVFFQAKPTLAIALALVAAASWVAVYVLGRK